MGSLAIPSIVAALPIRSLHNGKQRLAGLLAPPQREQLIRYVAQGVIRALSDVPMIQDIVVVSGEQAVLDWAGRLGATTLHEDGPGLNPAVEVVRQWAGQRGADGLLVILPDLPLLAAHDVRAMIDLSRPDSVTLAPDRHGSGTNALLLRPPNLLPFRFGERSLEAHLLLARRAGTTIFLCTRPGLAFDLDTPADLAALGPNHPVSALTPQAGISEAGDMA